MPRWGPVGSLLLFAAASCLQATSSGPVVGNPGGHQSSRRGSTSGGRTSTTTPTSSSGGSGSSSSGGSGLGGSSGGSSATGSGGGSSTGGSVDGPSDAGTYFCPAIAAAPVQINCPSADLGLGSQLVDVFDCSAIDSANIVGLDPNGVPISGSAATTSATDGTFVLCGSPSVPFTIQAKAAGYPTTYFAELEGELSTSIVQVGLVSSNFLAAFSALVQGGLDTSKATLMVVVTNSVLCEQVRPGWSLGISFPDGGSVPDGGYQLVYGDSSGLPTPGLTSTQSSGVALFYDIDPQLGDFFVVDYQHADAGGCWPEEAASGLTGRVYTAGGAVSIFLIRLPLVP